MCSGKHLVFVQPSKFSVQLNPPFLSLTVHTQLTYNSVVTNNTTENVAKLCYPNVHVHVHVNNLPKNTYLVTQLL